MVSIGLAPVVGKLIDKGNPKRFAAAGFSLLALSLLGAVLGSAAIAAVSLIGAVCAAVRPQEWQAERAGARAGE